MYIRLKYAKSIDGEELVPLIDDGLSDGCHGTDGGEGGGRLQSSKGERVSATEARRLVDCINMLAVRFTPRFRASRPWALSHRSCESEIKLSPKLPADVEVEDTTLVSKVLSPFSLSLRLSCASFYSNQIVSVAVSISATPCQSQCLCLK